jgi:hypothetical protein
MVLTSLEDLETDSKLRFIYETQRSTSSINEPLPMTDQEQTEEPQGYDKRRIFFQAFLLLAVFILPWSSGNSGSLWDIYIGEGSEVYALKYFVAGGACLSLFSLIKFKKQQRFLKAFVILAVLVMIFKIPIQVLEAGNTPAGWFEKSMEMTFEQHGFGAWAALTAALFS